MALLPPSPVGSPPGSAYWNDWYEKLRSLVNSLDLGSGLNATVPLAKITPGGTDGSLTFTSGILTALTLPT